MIYVINGPNLNMLEYRNEKIYGNTTIEQINKKIENKYNDVEFYQSNFEGEIIEIIHKGIVEKINGIVINPGAYSHYSYAIRDALEMFSNKKVEVHLSDIKNRELFRQKKVTGEVCDKVISGKGMDGYFEAIQFILGEEK